MRDSSSPRAIPLEIKRTSITRLKLLCKFDYEIETPCLARSVLRKIKRTSITRLKPMLIASVLTAVQIKSEIET